MVVPKSCGSLSSSLFFSLRLPTPWAPIRIRVFLLNGGTLATSSYNNISCLSNSDRGRREGEEHERKGKRGKRHSYYLLFGKKKYNFRVVQIFFLQGWFCYLHFWWSHTSSSSSSSLQHQYKDSLSHESSLTLVIAEHSSHPGPLAD